MYVVESHNSVLSVDENIELLNSNQPNDFKNHDIVFLKHFESITEVYITKNAKLFNNLMLDIIQDNCKFIYYLKLSELIQFNQLMDIFIFF